jgi:Beta-galactosidase/Beta-galactosidase trimerisation domain
MMASNGTRARLRILILVLASIVLLSSAAIARDIQTELKDVTGDGQKDILVSNGFFSAVIEPARGGNITSFLLDGKLEFTVREDKPSDGFFKMFIRPNGWRGDFHQKPFSYKFLKNTPALCVIEFKRTGEIGDLKFADLTKTYTIRSDSPMVIADIDVAVQRRAQNPLRLGLWVHQSVNVPDGNLRIFYPTKEGVKGVDSVSLSGGVWNKKPSRGWNAFIETGSSSGCAFFVDYTYLDRGLHWLAKRKETVSTEHWFMVAPIPHGESWKTRVTCVPFKGFSRIDGAGESLVGAIELEGGAPRLKLASGIDQKVMLKMFLADPKDGKKVVVSLPDQTVSLKAFKATVIATPKLTSKSKGVFVCEAYVGKKRIARIERLLCKDAAYPMIALKKQFVPAQAPNYYPTISRELVTPHRVWAGKFPGGTLKPLFLTTIDHRRQIIELAQRFDMDWIEAPIGGRKPFEYRHLYGVKQGKWMLSDKDGIAKVTAALKKPTPVMVMTAEYYKKYNKQYFSWDKLPKGMRKRILKKVEAGTGLVIYNPAGFDEETKKLLFGKAVDEKHYLLNWAPKGMLFSKRGNSVLVKEYGKGRVVIINAKCNGLTPYYDCAFEPKPRQLTDYYYAFAMRAMLWASRREPTAKLVAGKSNGANLKLALSDAPANGKVVWEVFDERGLIVAQGASSVAGNKATVFPKLPSIQGDYYVHAYLRTGETVYDWRVDKIAVSSPARITHAEVARAPGKDWIAQVAVSVSGNVKELKARTLIRSLTGDLYGEANHIVRKGANTLDIRVPRMPGISSKLRVELISGGKVIDRRDLNLNFPQKMAAMRKRFFPMVWATPSGLTDYDDSLLVGWQLRRIGFKTTLTSTANFNVLQGRNGQTFNSTDLANMMQNMRHQGLRDHNLVYKYQQTKDKKYLIRKGKCVSDPAYQKATADTFNRIVDRTAHIATLLYHWGDECSYTFEGGRLPIDICFSPHCLKAIRVWLKGQYPSLEALNAEWGTKFKNWDAVTPMTFEEAKAHGNFAPWADHRLFSDQLYALGLHKKNSDIIRKRDPGALVGEGGISANLLAYGGYNWPLKMTAFSHLIPYGNTIIISQLSPWFPNFSYSARWVGYNRPPVMNQYNIWRYLLFGAKSVSYWYYRHMVDPDRTLNEHGLAMQELLGELNSGTGDLLVKGTRQFDKVGVLYSQPSVLGAYILNGQGAQTYSLYEKNTINWLEAFFDAGYQPIMLTEDRIAEADLKVIVLPMSIALSKKGVAALRGFVRNGGLLIADIMPGIMTDHGRLLKKGQLDDLFGIQRKKMVSLQVKNVKLKIKSVDLGIPSAEMGGVLMEGGLKAKGSKPAASMAGKPTRVGGLTFSRGGKSSSEAFYFRKVGKGSTLYMGIMPKSLRSATGRNLLIDMLTTCGVKPGVTVHTPKGAIAQGIYVNRYKLGDISIIGMAIPPESIKDASIPRLRVDELGKLAQDAILKVSGTNHYYDVRKKTYLGSGPSAKVKIIPATGNLYAVSPFRIGGVKMANGIITAKPGETVTLKGVIDGSPKLSSFVHLSFKTGHSDRDMLLAELVEVNGGEFATSLLLPKDSKGEWAITVTEAITGQTADVKIRIIE